MRAFFVLILVAAISFLGWHYFTRSESAPKLPPLPSFISEALPKNLTPPPPATPEPPRIAPPGTYFITQRILQGTKNGVRELVPGDEVKLMFREKDGTMLVTDGQDEFRIAPSAASKDRTDAMRAAAH